MKRKKGEEWRLIGLTGYIKQIQQCIWVDEIFCTQIAILDTVCVWFGDR